MDVLPLRLVECWRSQRLITAGAVSDAVETLLPAPAIQTHSRSLREGRLHSRTIYPVARRQREPRGKYLLPDFFGKEIAVKHLADQ